jgi:hypothetical protein
LVIYVTVSAFGRSAQTCLMSILPRIHHAGARGRHRE